jgi:hypothetical protein
MLDFSLPKTAKEKVEEEHLLFTLSRKEKLALQKQQLPWRSLYRGGKPPEDGCMKPKHVV